MQAVKPFEIAKHLVWQAYRSVKANGGVDQVFLKYGIMLSH